MSSECPRGGWIWLTANDGRRIVMPTSCKTWSCRGCRDRLKNLFQMRVELGVSVLRHCAFTTFTYRQGEGLQRSAQSVREDWKELWRRLKKSDLLGENLKWLRVVELTKKHQPHLHVVMGPIKRRIRCYGREGIKAAVFNQRRGCDCLSHELSEVWRGITESWIVHTVPVVGARGAGKYLQKYMAKGHGQREELEAMGFSRRWSSSRGWPGSGRVRLRRTVEGGWKNVDFLRKNQRGFGSIKLEDKESDLYERVGTDLAVALGARNQRERVVGTLRRLQGAEANS